MDNLDWFYTSVDVAIKGTQNIYIKYCNSYWYLISTLNYNELIYGCAQDEF